MNDLLQILFTVVTVIIAIVATYFITRYFMRGKLAYVIFPFLTLVNPKTSFRKKLEIRYGGIEVDNIASIKIKFKNIGSKAIRKKDFRGGRIEVVFPGDVEIIDWEYNFSSKIRQPRIYYLGDDEKVYTRGAIGIEVDYFDKDESLTVDILCTGSKIVEPKIIAEIADAETKKYRGIDEEEAKREVKDRMSSVFSFMFLGLFFLIGGLGIIIIDHPPITEIKNYLPLIFFSLVFFTMTIFTYHKIRILKKIILS